MLSALRVELTVKMEKNTFSLSRIPSLPEIAELPLITFLITEMGWGMLGAISEGLTSDTST